MIYTYRITNEYTSIPPRRCPSKKHDRPARSRIRDQASISVHPVPPVNAKDRIGRKGLPLHFLHRTSSRYPLCPVFRRSGAPNFGIRTGIPRHTPTRKTAEYPPRNRVAVFIRTSTACQGANLSPLYFLVLICPLFLPYVFLIRRSSVRVTHAPPGIPKPG